MKLAVALLYDIQVTILSVNVGLRGVFAPNRNAPFRAKVWPNKPEVYVHGQNINKRRFVCLNKDHSLKVYRKLIV
jgi:hypothetical protein